VYTALCMIISKNIRLEKCRNLRPSENKLRRARFLVYIGGTEGLARPGRGSQSNTSVKDLSPKHVNFYDLPLHCWVRSMCVCRSAG
jgi:hypothetical protein